MAETWRSTSSEAALPIEAVVVDLDDTLFDHRRSARLGLFAFLERRGAPPLERLADEWENTAAELMRRRLAGEFGRTEYRRRRILHLLEQVQETSGRGSMPQDEAALDALYTEYVDVYEASWVGFPDAVPFLCGLRGANVPVAVLTNGPDDRQQRKMRALGCEELVVGTFSSDTIGCRKPDPRAYLTVCEALGTAPPRVLHVGDDPELDMHGAVAAGLQAVHLDRGGATGTDPHRVEGLEMLVPLVLSAGSGS